MIVLDESMSVYIPQTTKTGGFHNISFIMRKPENLGTEFKSIVCPVLGVMTYLEIQMDKQYMKRPNILQSWVLQPLVDLEHRSI